MACVYSQTVISWESANTLPLHKLWHACYEMGRKVIPATGYIRLFGRNASLGAALANADVTFWESLAGLEARINGQGVVVLREYRTFKQMAVHRWN